jgi:hypothetical protein
MDVPEVRNPIGDVSSRFLPACRCDQHTNSYADPHSDGQRNGFAEYLRFFFAAKCVGRTTDAVGRSTICVLELAFDVIQVVWQTISQGVKQAETGIEQDAKEWFSLSESHGVSWRYFVDAKMQNSGEMLAETPTPVPLCAFNDNS